MRWSEYSHNSDLVSRNYKKTRAKNRIYNVTRFFSSRCITRGEIDFQISNENWFDELEHVLWKKKMNYNITGDWIINPFLRDVCFGKSRCYRWCGYTRIFLIGPIIRDTILQYNSRFYLFRSECILIISQLLRL